MWVLINFKKNIVLNIKIKHFSSKSVQLQSYFNMFSTTSYSIQKLMNLSTPSNDKARSTEVWREDNVIDA